MALKGAFDSRSRTNTGLTTWRKRKAEAKEEILEMISQLPTTTEIRDGREFTVIRIPDKYGPDGPSGTQGKSLYD